MAKRRAKNLNDADIETAVEILDGWTGKLTWDALIDAIENRTRARYTRQALHNHQRIKTAFQLSKERVSGTEKNKEDQPRKLSSAEVQVLQQRYARLEAENARLKAENEHLLEQFVVWAYNAHTRNLDKNFLSQPLPGVNRDPTVKPEKAVRSTKH